MTQQSFGHSKKPLPSSPGSAHFEESFLPTSQAWWYDDAVAIKRMKLKVQDENSVLKLLDEVGHGP